MVGDKNITLLFFQMFTTFYLDRNQKQLQDQFTPPVARIIAPEMPVANGGTNTHLQRRYNRQDHQQWQPYYQLINLI